MYLLTQTIGLMKQWRHKWRLYLGSTHSLSALAVIKLTTTIMTLVTTKSLTMTFASTATMNCKQSAEK